MDSIAGTGLEGERQGDFHPPALLVVVLDTNPYAWNELSPFISLSKAVSDLLIFINAHLAFNHANRVAVLASHCRKTAWLYPTSPSPLRHKHHHHHHDQNQNGAKNESDALPSSSGPNSSPRSNKYRPFAVVEHELTQNLRALLDTTTEADLLASPTSTSLAGALTIALSYISKTASSGSAPTASLGSSDPLPSADSSARPIPNGRILTVSVSGDLATQYISLMNVIFAAQHLRVPLDILKLAGDTILLQQASYTTSGVFLLPSSVPETLFGQGPNKNAHTDAGDPFHPSTQKATASTDRSTTVSKKSATDAASQEQFSLLPTLLFAFLPDPITRANLIPPTAINVDFRAACFCHRRVVDVGYVCSICLSIFCEEGLVTYMQGGDGGNGGAGGARAEPAATTLQSSGRKDVTCLTCGTELVMKTFGADQAVLDDNGRVRKKKKKKRKEGYGAGEGD